jgi:hypothetical protein
VKFSGPGNTYTGLTSVSGRLLLEKSSGDGIGTGGVSILGILTLGASHQINDAAPVNLIGGGALRLNNFTESIGALTLTATNTAAPAVLQTGATGTLQLAGNLVLANNANSVLNGERVVLITGTGTGGSSGTGTPAFDGTLDLGGVMRNIAVTTTVTGANQFRAKAGIETVVTNGGIVKTGTQPLHLLNPANTFALGFDIRDGEIVISHPGALGTGPIFFSSAPGATGALNFINQNTTPGSGVAIANALQIGGTGGTNKIIYNGVKQTTLTFSGPVALNERLDVDVLNGTTNLDDWAVVDLAGQLDDGAGSFGIFKTGKGQLKLAPGNLFDGGATIALGTLTIGADSALGNVAAPVTIAGGALHVTADITTPRAVFFTSPGTLRADIDMTLECTGAYSPNNNAAGFLGGGTVIFSGTGGGGTGDLFVGFQGSQYADTPTASFSDGGPTVSFRGTVALPSGLIQILNGGVLELGNSDMLRTYGNSSGQVLVLGGGEGAGFAAHGADRNVNFGGAAAPLTWGQQTPPFLFGTSGATQIIGRLLLGSETATHTLVWHNPIELNRGSGVNFTRTIRVRDGAADVDARLTGRIGYTGPVAANESVTLEIDTTEGAGVEIEGALDGNGGIEVLGIGDVLLKGANTYTGFTVVSSALLEVAPGSSLGATRGIVVEFGGLLDALALPGPVNVESLEISGPASTFAGSANVSDIMLADGIIDGSVTMLPGSTATLINHTLIVSGDLTLAATSTLEAEIAGTVPGPAGLAGFHSQANVGGLVSPGGATLDVSLNYTPQLGDRIFLLLNDGTDAIAGTFAGLPEGGTLVVGGVTFQASYTANGDSGTVGNDFALTAISVPSNVAVITAFTFTDGTGAEAGLKVVDITATGTPGLVYRLEASTDLLAWTTVQTLTADAMTGALAFHITQDPNIPKRFFRIATP